MTAGTPRAEVEISVDLVRALLRNQHPQWADATITRFSEGWDNCMFRLGDELVVRLPRRELAAELIRNEQAHLAGIAPRLPVAVPAPVAVGEPGCGYPWGWSIAPWIDGAPVEETGLARGEGESLAGLLRALHAPADETAPHNPHRGVPLRRRQALIEERMARLESETSAITPGIRAVWRAALEAGPAVERVWLHGDPHPNNVLQIDGRISGLIDWGDICGGDPASDLSSIWMLLGDAGDRASALAAYGADDALISRARGWAVQYGVILLETGRVDNPRYARIGDAILRRVAADA